MKLGEKPKQDRKDKIGGITGSVSLTHCENGIYFAKLDRNDHGQQAREAREDCGITQLARQQRVIEHDTAHAHQFA